MVHPDLSSGPVTPPSSRKAPVTVPWRTVARRLAEGEKPAAIAAGLGLEEDRIWRHLRRSLRFRTYLRQAIERQRQLADLLLGSAGRNAMLSRGLQPESLDGELLRCLLEEATAVAGADPAPSAELAGRIERLGETGAPPPNMAFRARLAAERRNMDAQFAVIKAEIAAYDARRRASRPDTGEPERSQTGSSEAKRTETNQNEPERSETNPNEAERSETKSAEPPSRPPRPAMPQPAEPPRAIVDIDGPDRARLAATGALQRPALPDHAEDG